MEVENITTWKNPGATKGLVGMKKITEMVH